jgi:two-component system, LytTR family, response regulator
MIRSIIIDDEKPARDVLKNYLAEFCPEVLVVSMADSLKTGLKMINQHQPDLVFLDIEMPNGNGFDLLRKLPQINFKIVFVTAYSEFALKAFRFYATDYLLKPVNIDELKEAVNKVRGELDRHHENTNIEELQGFSKTPDAGFNVIVIPDKKGFVVVDIPDIVFCSADSYCTTFQIADGRQLTSSKNLKFYEELLEDKCFMRVHNSHLVNLKHIKGYNNEGFIILTHDLTAPLGNTYKKRFLEKFADCR